MKMTKKLFLVAIATAAFALTSCAELLGGDSFKGKNENGVDNGSAKDTGTKYKLSIDVEAKNDTENGSKRFQRMFKQLGNKETVRELQTVISVDTTSVDSYLKSVSGTGDEELFTVVTEPTENPVNYDRFAHAVTGLIFDMHCTKEVPADGGKKVKYYDFVLIGYRPYDNGFYIEKYTDVTEDMFAGSTNASSFKDPADLYITDTDNTSKFYEYAADHTKDFAKDDYTGDAWVTKANSKLGKDDDGKDYGDKAVPLKKFTVTITQPEKGKFNINIAGKDFTYAPADESATHPDWYTKENKLTKTEAGYRIGGAGYYVNAPLGTAVKAMFDSKNDTTKGLEEEVAE